MNGTINSKPTTYGKSKMNTSECFVLLELLTERQTHIHYAIGVGLHNARQIF